MLQDGRDRHDGHSLGPGRVTYSWELMPKGALPAPTSSLAEVSPGVKILHFQSLFGEIALALGDVQARVVGVGQPVQHDGDFLFAPRTGRSRRKSRRTPTKPA